MVLFIVFHLSINVVSLVTVFL